jgi:acyl-CoA synthetase (NDP forming)/GNAT superfamily N-acetyltransferase
VATPVEWEGDVALSDGGTVHVRPVSPGDAERLVRFHGRQSPESIYLRFFTALPALSARQVERFTTVDSEDRMAFVALLGDDLVGIAGWDGLDAGRAEIALSVDDAHRGRGVGTVLLEYLAAAARDAGITEFTGTVLPSNRRMLDVFRAAGFDATSRYADGLVEVSLSIDPTERTRAAIEARERKAEARSVARVLAPRTVAVVGAGRRPGTVGHEAFRNLLANGFQGAAYPVNREAHHVASVRAWSSVLDVPDEIDLAVVAVPPAAVPGVVRECAAKRVRAVVVLTTGVEDGAGIAAAARGSGMRLVGPGSLGVVNTDPAVRLQGTFVPVVPAAGRVACCSQSGPLGAAILERLRELGVGVSTFVDAGTKADLSANDLLQYWEGDDRTGVVLLYLESFGNPRKFARLARRVATTKPVVAVAAAGGHADALLAQLGVIRVDSLDHLFDVARVLDGHPVPAGRRAAIVANTEGAAALAAEVFAAAGVHVTGTVALAPGAGAADYGAAVGSVAASGEAHAALVLYAPHFEASPVDVVAAVTAAVAATAGGEQGFPVVASCFGALTGAERAAAGVPTFTFPDDAARALAKVAAYGEWRALPAGREVVPEGVDGEAVAAAVRRELAACPGGRVLPLGTAMALLDRAAGLPMARSSLAGSADEAVAAAADLGGPVALKATGLAALAKTEAGGLALDVTGPDEVRAAYGRMLAALGDAMRPAVVQEMVAPGVDLSVGVRQGGAVGPVVVVGPGGAGAASGGAADVVGAVPLTDVDAERLVDAAPGPVPEGARAGLADLLLRLAHLADTVPELAEVVCNPVIASGAGVAVVDVRVAVAPAPARPVVPDVRRLG